MGSIISLIDFGVQIVQETLQWMSSRLNPAQGLFQGS